MKHVEYYRLFKRKHYCWKTLPLGITGWNPELVFLTILFSNSTVLTVLMPNTSVFDTLFTL